MAKNLKLQIKNTQIADAINLRGLKAKLSKKKHDAQEDEHAEDLEAHEVVKAEVASEEVQEDKPKKSRVKKAKDEITETKSVASEVEAAPTEPQEPIAQPSVEGKVQETKLQEKIVVQEQKVEATPAVSRSEPQREIPAQPAAEQKRETVAPQQQAPIQPARSSYPQQGERRENYSGREHSQGRDYSSGPRSNWGSGQRDRGSQSSFRDSREPRDYNREPREPRDYNREQRDYGNRPASQGPRPSSGPQRGFGGAPSSYDRPSSGPQRGFGGASSSYDRPSSGQQRGVGGTPSSYDRSGFRPRPAQGSERSDSRPYPQQRRDGPNRPFEGGRPPFRSDRPGGDSRFQGREQRRYEPFVRNQSPVIPKQDVPVDRGWKSDRPERAPEKKEVSKGDIDELDRHLKGKAKDVKDSKFARKTEVKDFDARARHGFRSDDEENQVWRKKRPSKLMRQNQEQEIIRPTKISVHLPISVKDLAQEMKLKASQLISKLFMQGVVATLNDYLTDETSVQLLGHEFGCEISIDTAEEERIRITDKTIREEIAQQNPEDLVPRSPVVAFMGHVDHGKTSLIDAIRKSKRAQYEVGAITQHIGAFKTSTSHGDIAILDTPGHEAFSLMRERGAGITDIVVLVVAGDEGIKQQTVEALNQAKESSATIVVAINKCDKPAYNAENVYRQLADHGLLPEVWGGQTITVQCSAQTGQGIPELLELIALQSEVLELRANPKSRARGTVIESQMYKGLGPVTCVLVQNGTLRVGDALVFGANWARVKAMRDENGLEVQEAGPSTPVVINGLSGLPDAGDEFIVVKNEKEARDIAEVRQQDRRESNFQTTKKLSLENMMEKAQDTLVKKVLNIILRADVQGSLEALKNALMRIHSDKVEVNVVSHAVGEVSESDVQLALASKAVIVGFHTQIEAHAEPLIKEFGVQVRLHNIIYHAVDDVRDLMKGLLNKIAKESDKGRAEVKATFKASQLGIIAGCMVLDGTISRNCMIRIMRDGQQVWKGPIASIKRVKEDVKEVSKGFECGILLHGYNEVKEGDILEAYEVIYLTQEL